MDQIERVRTDCRMFGEAMRDLLSRKRVEEDPRYGCFWMMYNKATVALETLNYFQRTWESIDMATSEERLNQLKLENTERCIEIARSLFIGCMSAIEFCAKENIKLYPDSRLARRLDELRSRRRYIFLRGIMQESLSLGILTEKQEAEWTGMIILRNLAVHNNAVSDMDADIEVGEMSFLLRKGDMIVGGLSTYADLTLRAVTSYHNWICKLDLDALTRS